MTDDTELLLSHPGFSAIEDGVDYLDGMGCMPESAAAVRLLAARDGARGREIDRLTAENARLTEQLTAWLCVCPEGYPADFDPDAECAVHGDPRVSGVSMRGLLRYRDAFEALHARILRDLPGDGSELPQPDDAFWAAQLDGLTAYADEMYRQTEPRTVPAATDNERQ